MNVFWIDDARSTTTLKYLLLLFISWGTSAVACDDPLQRQQMIDSLAKDKEFVEFICGSELCGADELTAGVTFRSELLRVKPRAIGCFVEPRTKAKNIYTGVFVILDSQPAEPQFVFFGSGIGSIKKVFGGLKVIQGHEIGEAGTKEIHVFRWNGHVYIGH